LELTHFRVNIAQHPASNLVGGAQHPIAANFVKMTVIIRLQNLPWSANAADIRQFFRGLAIPEGGVHIVGGAAGDAFIAFRYIFNCCIFRLKMITNSLKEEYIHVSMNFRGGARH